MDKAEAERLVRAKLEEYEKRGSPELVILKEKTLTRPFGWVFFYQSKRYMETGSFVDQVAGNGPIIVDRDDQSLHLTGTALPISQYIKRYEAEKAERRRTALPKCPACSASMGESARIDLYLTVRTEDSARVCMAVWTCPACEKRAWRWNDRPTAPLQRFVE